jgi:glycerate 2-kinase
VVHLISGGTSALAAAPLPGLLSRADKTLLHRLLIGSGLGIREINLVRKHFSAIKGGRLAAGAPDARQVSLLFSDAPLDCPEAVGSGPTLPDPSTWNECLEILRGAGIFQELPAALRRRISRRRWPETPKPGDPCFRRSVLRVLADSGTLVESAARHAQRLGYTTRILAGTVEGTPEEFLDRMLRHRQPWRGSTDRPRCILASGEVRVVPAGRGRGGRAQDLALAAALRLEGVTGVVFLAAGSDGKDGNSPAAGALSDGRTVRRARRLGLDPVRLRDRSDTYRLFRALGDGVITGSTGNNLRDLYLLMEAGVANRNQRAPS